MKLPIVNKEDLRRLSEGYLKREPKIDPNKVIHREPEMVRDGSLGGFSISILLIIFFIVMTILTYFNLI